jgi:monofunctional biosynthetic peptidoglycan transglycosylase
MAERMAEARAKNPKATISISLGPYARISANLKRAMVAAEDAKFTEHGGFDWDGIETRSRRTGARGRSSRAARRSRSSSRRISSLSRDELLAQGRGGRDHRAARSDASEAPHPGALLNVIEWGNGVFGAEAAAQRYFGVSAAISTPSRRRASPRWRRARACSKTARFGLSCRPHVDDPRAHAGGGDSVESRSARRVATRWRNAAQG